MRSFWADPYFWVHLLGLAMVPLLLEVVLLGLAAGDPLLPAGLDWLVIGLVGTVPILWMQWFRPFYIYSLPFVVLRPGFLSDDQRRVLRRLRSVPTRAIALVGAIIALLALQQLYRIAPIASLSTPFEPRPLGLGIAAIAFLLANLFWQVPLSVASVMVMGDADFAALEPCPPEMAIAQFTRIGIPLSRLLPERITGWPAVPPPVETVTESEPEDQAQSQTQSQSQSENQSEDQSEDQSKPDDQHPIESEAQSKLENQTQSEDQSKSEDQAISQDQTDDQTDDQSDDQAKPEVQSKSEDSPQSEDLLQSEDLSQPEVQSAGVQVEMTQAGNTGEIASDEVAPGEIPSSEIASDFDEAATSDPESSAAEPKAD